MKSVACVLLLCLAACSPSSNGQDPRDRKGAGGAPAWYVVAQNDGHAAFLARPGTAPDLVLWCKKDGVLTLRAHVFDAPKAQPDLKLITSQGTLNFTNVRRQGGVREGDRKLVEGTLRMDDPQMAAVLIGASSLTATSDGAEYTVQNVDPNNQLPQFAKACFAPTSNTKAP